MSRGSPVATLIVSEASEPDEVRTAADDSNDTAIAVAVAALRRGDLVAYPTDTVYGLAADPRQVDAVSRLFRAKQRRQDLAIPVIAADLDQVAQVGELSPRGRLLAATFWPGPLTLVIAAHADVNRRLLGGHDTIAVRVPASGIARSLARHLDFPVTATSANLSGAPAPTTAAGVVSMLGAELALVLDGGSARHTEPSTIVDVSCEDARLIRPGRVPWDRVLQSLA